MSKLVVAICIKKIKRLTKYKEIKLGIAIKIQIIYNETKNNTKK